MKAKRRELNIKDEEDRSVTVDKRETSSKMRFVCSDPLLSVIICAAFLPILRGKKMLLYSFELIKLSKTP